MAKELLGQILDRMGDYVVDLDALEPYPHQGTNNGWTSIPATFTPGPRLLPVDADAPAHVLSPDTMTEEPYDVVVLGTGAAGLTRGTDRVARRGSVGAVREGRAGRRHDGAVQRGGVAPGQPLRPRGRRGRLAARKGWPTWPRSRTA